MKIRTLPLLVALATGVAACVVADSEPRERSDPRFTLLPSSLTGVTFDNPLEEDAVRNGLSYEYYYNGGGVAVGDLNGDDLPDLYFTSNLAPNRLYLNRGGLRFEDVTARADVRGHTGWATGVTFADVNADGRLDIYVSYSGAYDDPDLRRNLLYINQGVRAGVPVFTEEAAAFGLDDRGLSTQAAFFDYDVDGDLDMYLMNHGVAGYHTLVELQQARSPEQIDRLYRNDGGRFVDVSEDAGLHDTNLGFGLGLSVGDLNNDGRPDIYVANDYSGRDYLYLGQPGGRFVDALTASVGHTPFASMGSDIADIDGDGWFDLAVLDMAMPTHYDRQTSEAGVQGERFAAVVATGQHYQYPANTLQWNRGIRPGGGSAGPARAAPVPVFSEIASLAGVARSDWSWAALFADFDNDGRPDLLATTGTAGNLVNADFNEYRRRRTQQAVAAEGRVSPTLMVELLENLPRRAVRNRAYRNEGDLEFSDRTAEWGLDQPSYAHGAAYADLDRDGDLDLVVNNLASEAFVFRNNSREIGDAHMLAVAFRGPSGNPFGVGTRVRIVAGGAQQVQELQLTRGYQSSVEPVLHFGLGANALVDTLEVVWPDGARELRTDVQADRYLLDYAGARADVRETAAGDRDAGALDPLFSVASGAIQPRPGYAATVSTVDPGLQPYPSRRDDVALAVGDLDANGLEDFVFGGNGGEPARAYLQQDDGTFRGDAIDARAREREVAVAATIFDADGDGHADIWLAAREAVGFGMGAGAGSVAGTGTTVAAAAIYRHRLYRNEEGTGFREAPGAAPDGLADAGAVLAPGDYDGDGDVDLFVGSRTVPGSGPAAGSRLLQNEAGRFRDVTDRAARALAALGTVTDALWTDLNGDGALDLVVVGEWLPVTFLANDDGVFRDATPPAGLGALTGWWQSVAAADFDGDGDVDLVAGNMGLNYPYAPSDDAPFELYVHDFSGNGRDVAVPAYYEAGQHYPWLGRSSLASALPHLLDRFPTHDAFARATLTEILGADALRSARRLEVRTLATTYLENMGAGRFRARPLPRAAQVSPVTGIVPADFDGDGAIDLVLAGNLHALDSAVPRADAGVGLFLRGDRAGGFLPVMPMESGLLIEGEVRRMTGIRVAGHAAPGLLAAVTGVGAVHVRAGSRAGAVRTDRRF
jgi:enediyne biosynthesis protein E4